MWIFLNDAMVSAVAHRTKPGHLMVRARLAGDLERLFPRAKVERTPDADYAYRCTVTRTVFANVVAARAAAIDYPNFKGSLATAKGDQPPSTYMARSQAYHRTWDAMMDAQQELEPDTGRGAW